NDASSPAIALAATVGGLASQTCPGPERPGKLRLIALTVTCSAAVDAPGPQFAHAPQAGCSRFAPTASKAARQPCRMQCSRTSSVPNCRYSVTPGATFRPR